MVIACVYSHIMIDLKLVNEDTCIFGNKISIEGDVSCGAKAEESFNNYITNTTVNTKVL